jgi:hypothetical protein
MPSEENRQRLNALLVFPQIDYINHYMAEMWIACDFERIKGNGKEAMGKDEGRDEVYWGERWGFSNYYSVRRKDRDWGSQISPFLIVD